MQLQECSCDVQVKNQPKHTFRNSIYFERDKPSQMHCLLDNQKEELPFTNYATQNCSMTVVSTILHLSGLKDRISVLNVFLEASPTDFSKTFPNKPLLSECMFKQIDSTCKNKEKTSIQRNLFWATG